MEEKWYAVRTFPGYEYKVQDKLLKKVEKEKLGNVISETYIPVYKNYIFVRKNLKLREELIYPGYVFIKMNLTNEVMYFVRGIQYVIGYAGTSENKKFPDPVSQSEVDQMIIESQKFTLALEVGDNTKINDGFETKTGKVQTIDPKTEKIDVQIDGEIKTYNFNQIEKM